MDKVQERYKSTNVSALMLDEFRRVFAYIEAMEEPLQSYHDIPLRLINIRAESSARRVMQELHKRYYRLTPAERAYFSRSGEEEQRLLLFMACMKLYRLLYDAVMEVARPMWQRGETHITSLDVQNLIDQKAEEQPHTQQWTVTTRKNAGGFVMRMLREAGMLREGKLRPLEAPHDFWQLMVQEGELWMLEAALLNKNQRNFYLRYGNA